MKLSVLCFLFVGTAFCQFVPTAYTKSAAAACTPYANRLHCRVITVQATSAGNGYTGSVLTAFPAVTQTSGTALTLGASKILQANGYDVVFTSDTNPAVTLVPWELERFNVATGEVIAWFPVTTSSSVTVKYYMSYGYALATQLNTGGNAPTAVWDANTLARFHVSDGTTLSYLDSTTASTTATPSATPPTATTGEIDGGAAFASASTEFFRYTFTSNGGAYTTAYTYSFWVNGVAAPSTSNGFMLPFSLNDNSGTAGFYWNHTNASFYQACFQTGSSATVSAQLTDTLSSGTWYHIACTWDSSNLRAYMNGVLKATTAKTTIDNAAAAIAVGARYNSGSPTTPLNGSMDEIEVSKVARSADYLLATYNNATGVFLSIGAEQ